VNVDWTGGEGRGACKRKIARRDSDAGVIYM
jgi:hypothetical protein